MRRPVLVTLASAAFVLAASGIASAHPLGNFTINHYAGLTIRADDVTVDYVIDMAEIPTFQERAVIDRDGDDILSSAELASYATGLCDTLRSGLSLRIDGRGLPLSVIAGKASLPLGQAGLSTLRVECAYRGVPAPGGEPSQRALEFSDANYAERIGWREITARGDGVDLDTTLPSVSQSARLTAYPKDLLSSPLSVRSGSARFVAAAASAVDAAPAVMSGAAPATDGRPTDPLASLIGQRDLSPFGLVTALLLAFGLGLLHALSPGHGKTVMAAYLVGTRGTRRQALVLGPVVALSHTAGVLLLGAVTLAASRLIDPSRLYPYLSAAAGVIVLAIGATLVQRRIRARAHEHGHGHEHGAPGAPLGWRPLVALGLSGGLVPSASALLLLLGAVHFDQVGLGLVLILVFGFGMAATLVGMGLALVGAHRFAAGAANGHRFVGRALRLVPELTAVLVFVLGLGMTAQALATIF